MDLRALVLEDSATQMRIVGNMLAKSGWAAMSAPDIETALEMAQSTRVALMLLDVYVGQDSSLAHLDRFRAAAPSTPIAIMTAGKSGGVSILDTLAAARRAKVEHLLPKPFAASDLEAILSEAERLAVGDARNRVLVVDDSATIRTIVRRALEPEGYLVAEAETMEHALDRMDILRVDLVVTDIFMPGMSGITGIGVIRKAWPDVAVIAMTSGLHAQIDAPTALRAAERVGAVRQLQKPFTAEALQAAVRDALKDSAAQAA